MTDNTFNEQPRKVWIFAGEASGDLYGARLARSLMEQSPDLIVQGMGGEEMSEAGVEILVDSSDLGIVGFVEVIKHLPMFLRIFNGLVRRAEKERPDAVVLIDYPGFNLRFARKMEKLGIKVIYYISPQVWAWGKGRVKEMARTIDHMIVIFPFEESFFSKSGIHTSFVGHPLVDVLRQNPLTEVKRQQDLIALLPGSRMSEIERHLEPLLETAAELYRQQPRYGFVLPLPNKRLQGHVQQEILRFWETRGTIPIEVIAGDTERQMRKATAGIAASGTVTVQAAILGLPLVVIYRLNPLTWMIGKRLVKIPYVTMVNLVAEETVYEEFLQGEVRPEKLVPALLRILPDGDRHKAVVEGMRKAVSRLRGGSPPNEAAARIVLEELYGVWPPLVTQPDDTGES